MQHLGSNSSKPEKCHNVKLGSLLLTGVQTSENWWAINRMGYDRLVSQCWGAGIENPEREGVARLSGRVVALDSERVHVRDLGNKYTRTMWPW